MKIENVRISGCSIQANNLAHILKIIFRQTLPGEVRPCMGEGWRS